MSIAADPKITSRERLLATIAKNATAFGTLPSAALELFALSARSGTSVQDLVSTLERDSALSASVLRIGGSPLYATRGSVSSIADAAQRLGQRTLVEIAFEAAISQGALDVRAHPAASRDLRKHSLVTAHVTRILCRHARIDTDHAFLSGLFHDVGWFALLDATAELAHEHTLSMETLLSESDALHEQVSASVASKLRLPSEVAEEIRNHHHLSADQTSRTAAAVALADDLSQRLGAGFSLLRTVVDTSPAASIDVARSILHVDDIVLNRVMIEAERVIPHISVG